MKLASSLTKQLLASYQYQYLFQSQDLQNMLMTIMDQILHSTCSFQLLNHRMEDYCCWCCSIGPKLAYLHYCCWCTSQVMDSYLMHFGCLENLYLLTRLGKNSWCRSIGLKNTVSCRCMTIRLLELVDSCNWRNIQHCWYCMINRSFELVRIRFHLLFRGLSKKHSNILEVTNKFRMSCWIGMIIARWAAIFAEDFFHSHFITIGFLMSILRILQRMD